MHITRYSLVFYKVVSCYLQPNVWIYFEIRFATCI